MKKTDLKKYQKLLLIKKKALFEDMDDILKERVNKTIKDATGDLSSYSYHMADQGTDAMEREMAFMLASKSGRLIYHIDEALRRIDKGNYGDCFVCEKLISTARLEAVPHARLCIECKSAEEENNSGKK